MNVRNILLVEDDILDIMDFKRNLEKMNILFSLTTARNGEVAMDLLDKWGAPGMDCLPDFVLIDINMPKLNGLELLAHIRSTEALKHLKCFIITTSDEKVDQEAAKKIGVSGYILKPFKLNNAKSMDSLNLMIDLMNN